MTGIDVHEVVADRLHRLGQRYTLGRRALVGVLARTGAPLSIPQLLGRDASLAQSSTYRNLTVLEQAGVVHRIVSADDFARYELAEDLTEHHHHLICASCGDVWDFTVPDALEAQITLVLAGVADEHDLAADHHRLDLVGTCARCCDRGAPAPR